MPKWKARNQYRGQYCHSFITKDNKYVIVFEDDIGYNVYNIRKDKWLLDKNIKDVFTNLHHAQSLMINDEIIVVSWRQHLDFYYILTHDLKYPTKISQCTLNTQGLNFSHHGMCCIECKCEKDEKGDENRFSIKLLLIGGAFHFNVFESFLIVDVSFRLPYFKKRKFESPKDNCNYKYNVKIINETKIKDIKFSNNFHNNIKNYQSTIINENMRWYFFGCHCLTNSKHFSQPIVILIGGNGNFITKDGNYDLGQSFASVFIFDVVKRQLNKISNVCLIFMCVFAIGHSVILFFFGLNHDINYLLC